MVVSALGSLVFVLGLVVSALGFVVSMLGFVVFRARPAARPGFADLRPNSREASIAKPGLTIAKPGPARCYRRRRVVPVSTKLEG